MDEIFGPKVLDQIKILFTTFEICFFLWMGHCFYKLHRNISINTMISLLVFTNDFAILVKS